MSTITKESIADTIEGLEHLADSGIQSVYIDMAIAGMRRLLASLEAEPVAHADPQAFRNFQTGAARREWMWRNPGEGLIPLFTAPPATVVPNGWVLVPVEPTTEMQSAAASAIRFETTPINKLWTGNAVYKSMLAAAPQQEVKNG